MVTSMTPREAWEEAERGEVKILDLRTKLERRRYGAPPGAIPVSLTRHIATPEGASAVYLCQHAVRSKLTGRGGGGGRLRRLGRSGSTGRAGPIAASAHLPQRTTSARSATSFAPTSSVSALRKFSASAQPSLRTER